MTDMTWISAFSADRIIQTATRYAEVSNGFTKKQREWSALHFFHGAEEGARCAGDATLERVYHDWIVGKLRPLGYDRALAELKRKGNVSVSTNGTSAGADGAGNSAA